MLVILLSIYQSNKIFTEYIISVIEYILIVFGIYIFLKSKLKTNIEIAVNIAKKSVITDVSENIKNHNIIVTILLMF